MTALTQIAFALAALAALDRLVFPAIARMRSPQVVTSVWAPVAIVAPMVVSATSRASSVAGAGWCALGAPVFFGAVATAAALWRKDEAPADGATGAADHARRRAATVAGAGLVLLLLGGAHDLSILAGQTIFAIVAVTLWMNAPAPADRAVAAAPGRGAAEARAALGLTIALLAGIGQGICARGAAPAAAAAVMAVYAVLAALSLAHRAAPAYLRAVAGWSAALGVLGSLSALSLAALVPRLVATIAGATASPGPVAHGFGAYALEAALLLALPVVGPLVARLDRTPRRAIAGGLAALAVMIALRGVMAISMA